MLLSVSLPLLPGSLLAPVLCSLCSAVGLAAADKLAPVR